MTAPKLRELIASGDDPLVLLSGDTQDRAESLADMLAGAVEDTDCRERLQETREVMRAVVDDYRRADLHDRADRLELRNEWSSELLDHPELVDVVAALVRDPVARLTVEWTVDITRRSHPLEVELPEGSWKCDSCGSTFEALQAAAVTVGNRPGGTDEVTAAGYQPTFCGSCLRTAADEADRHAAGR